MSQQGVGTASERRQRQSGARCPAPPSAQPGKLSLVDLDKHITRETKPKSGSGTSLYSDALHLTVSPRPCRAAQHVWLACRGSAATPQCLARGRSCAQAEGYAYMAQLVWEQVFAPVVGATQRRL